MGRKRHKKKLRICWGFLNLIFPDWKNALLQDFVRKSAGLHKQRGILKTEANEKKQITLEQIYICSKIIPIKSFCLLNVLKV